MAQDHHNVKAFVPLTFGYNYRVGAWMEKYLDGLSEKKILGVKCPSCGKVTVPPRSVCGACFTKPEQWVEVPPEGELRTFTVGRVKVAAGEIKDADEPYVIGMIKLDGADSLLSATVKGIDPDNLKPGIRLKAVFSDEPKGTTADLSYFEPVE